MTVERHYSSIAVSSDDDIWRIQIRRPECHNAIDGTLIAECLEALSCAESRAKLVVLEGLPDVFCVGADFEKLHSSGADGGGDAHDAEPLYDLWLKLATGPYVSVAHVRGKTNAGGIGFAAACDVAIAEEKAVFGLSELLFGLMPACVLPFLIRRVGTARAHYMALMTTAFSAQQALQWGLVDAIDRDSDNLLRKHLLRLRRLSKSGIVRYKTYLSSLESSVQEAKARAVQANKAAFADPENRAALGRFVTTGQFPWES